MKKLITPFLCILLVTGCAGLKEVFVPITPETPREIYITVETTFDELVRELTRQHELGLISQSTIDGLKSVVQAGSDILDVANLAVIGGDTVTLEAQLELVRALITQLRLHLAVEESRYGQPGHRLAYVG